MEIVKTVGDFKIVKNDDGWYEVYWGEEVLKTPRGKVAKTSYLEIAEALLEDWRDIGYYSYNTAYSMLSYHFIMVDQFAYRKKEKAIERINATDWEDSWTFKACPSGHPEAMMLWMLFYGRATERIEQIKQWFQNMTPMQLAAATCIANKFNSYNIAYLMALVVEEMEEKKQEAAIKSFWDFYHKFDYCLYLNFESFWEVFEKFRFYYGIHFKTDGKHLPGRKEKNKTHQKYE